MPGVDVRQPVVAVAVVKFYARFGVPAGGGKVPGEGERAPTEMVSFDEKFPIIQLSGETQDPTGLLAGCPQISRYHLVLPLAPQGDKQTAGVAVRL